MNEECEDGHLCVCEKPKRGRRTKERLPKEEPKESVTDQLDLSLPTPKPTDKSDLDDDSDDDSDDDIDFPVGLTPIKFSNTLHEKDLVWVKWKKWPHIPGLVKNVYKKKRKVTIVPFLPEDEPVQPFTMHISRKIFSYFDPRKAEILENIKSFSQENQDYFKKCVKRAEDFLMRKGLKQLEDDWAFFRDEEFLEEVDVQDGNQNDVQDEDKESTSIEQERLSKSVEIKMKENSKVKEEQKIDCNPEYCGLSKKGVQRQVHFDPGQVENHFLLVHGQVEKIRISTSLFIGESKILPSGNGFSQCNIVKRKLSEKTRALTDFLISDECKKYLFKIYKGEIQSDCHSVFMKGSMREKIAFKYQGFGPIDDEDQVETIVLKFHSWLNEVNTRPHLYANAYVFDVWVPEAVVFGLKKLHRYSKKKAWEKFQRGVRHTKEELQLVHEQLFRKSPPKETENELPLLKPPKRIKLKLS